MSLPVDVGQDARADLAETLAQLRERALSSATRFQQGVTAAFTTLADFPETGGLLGLRGRGLADVRALTVPGFANYVIYYRIHPDRIVILRVLRGVRRPGPALRQAQTPPPPGNGQTGGTPGP